MSKTFPYISYSKETYSEAETLRKSQEFYSWMNKRRTVREFSEKPISRTIIENILLSASTAPSGAHKQPWTFCVITSPEIKKKIRIEAEKEEYESYNGRMTAEWLDDLAPLGTDWNKPFLETAPALIVVLKRVYEFTEKGKKNNYYVSESVGLATGFLLAAIHNAGLVALTHTPSPMNFLTKILERPDNERPFLLIPIGYPLEKTQVPDLQRKTIEEMAVFYE
ncbi:MAG: nitroreductase family protein [Bacteroidia bacterium]|nr:nitroreductase family protein [Bacteroidia bacterium]